jgi:hypothetical protein
MTELPPGLPKGQNSEPCIMCRHLDPEALPSGVNYCWRWMLWARPECVVVDCSTFEPADGEEPPGKLQFEKPRRA